MIQNHQSPSPVAQSGNANKLTLFVISEFRLICYATSTEFFCLLNYKEKTEKNKKKDFKKRKMKKKRIKPNLCKI